MAYWVAVYVDGLGQWVHVGPVFTCRDDAMRFLESLPTPDKHVVQYEVGTNAEAPEILAGADVEGGLDRQRLEFVRYLYRSGRLNEGSEQSSSADGQRAVAA